MRTSAVLRAFALDCVGLAAYPAGMLRLMPRTARVRGAAIDEVVGWRPAEWCSYPWPGGTRALVHVGQPTAALSMRAIPLNRVGLDEGWHPHLHACTFYGHAVNRVFHVVDLLALHGDDYTRAPLRERLALLDTLADWLPAHAVILRSVPGPVARPTVPTLFRAWAGQWHDDHMLTLP